MSESEQIEKLLSDHRQALTEYHEWDQKVKKLLQGRRLKDLTPEDMAIYREVSEKRDNAYDRMRHHERALLENIPGAATGPHEPISPDDL